MIKNKSSIIATLWGGGGSVVMHAPFASFVDIGGFFFFFFFFPTCGGFMVS